MWKVLQSRWAVGLWVECRVLHWILCGSYCTAGGQWDFGLNEVCYSDIIWRVLHSMWAGLLWVECSVLQWTVCGKYCTAGGQWYCGLNVVCYSELYVEGTAQQVDSGIVGWMYCVTVNIMWKVLHSSWTVGWWVEYSVLQWTLCGRYYTAGELCYCGLNVVCYSGHYLEGTA